MKLSIKRGTTSKTLRVFIQDASKADGSGLKGLTAGSPGLAMFFCREGDSSATAVPLGQAALGVYTNVLAPPLAAPTVSTTGGGASGGSLQSGNYFLSFSYVSGSGETTPSPDTTVFAVAAGNIPQVTFQSLPAGASSRNVYLTAAGGPAGSETLYATGITTPTFNLTAAQAIGSAPPTVNTCPGRAGTGGGFVEMDSAHMPGAYEVSLPDASLAAGRSVLIYLQGALNMAPVVTEIELESVDRQDSLGFGMANLDVAISTRSTFAGGAVASVASPVILATPDSPVVHSGTARAGGNQTITLSSAASPVDAIYNGSRIRLTGGPGAGQTRIVTGYVGGTCVATVSRPWATNPDGTSSYAIIADDSVAPNGSLASTAVLAASGLDGVIVEPGVNARQALAPILAACAGAVSGAGTTSISIAAANNARTNRIQATVDSSGNRSSVVLNLPT